MFDDGGNQHYATSLLDFSGRLSIQLWQAYFCYQLISLNHRENQNLALLLFQLFRSHKQHLHCESFNKHHTSQDLRLILT
jgi:hypothetical protein